MKKHPIQSNIGAIASLQVHTYDRAFDDSWELDRSKLNHRPMKQRRKPLPSPLETRLALQSRLIIAETERKAWVEANRDKIIAAARAEVARKLNNN
jgi:hypothetical protein